MNSEKLTIADVERLLSDPSENARAEVAAKVARQFAEVELLPASASLRMRFSAISFTTSLFRSASRSPAV